MWVFTVYGFYSAVCARQGDGSRQNLPDPHRMMIRTRDREHLERLQARFPSLQRYEITESATNDYRFRIIIPKWRWQRVMSGLIHEQSYDNFKSEVDRVWGTKTPEQVRYHDKLLIRVWIAAYGFQTAKYGPGVYTKVRGKKKGADQGYLLPDLDHPPASDAEVSKAYGDTPLLEDEQSPFLEAHSITATGPEPLPNEQVLVVLDQDTAQEVVVIWSPGVYDDPARGYADAIAAKVCDIVARPEYQRMPWSEAKRGGAPVFDAQETLGG